MLEMRLLNIKYPELKFKSPGTVAAFNSLFTTYFPTGRFQIPSVSRMYAERLNPRYKDEGYDATDLYSIISTMLAESLTVRKLGDVRSYIEKRIFEQNARNNDALFLNYFSPRMSEGSNIRVPAQWLAQPPQDPWFILQKIAANSMHLYDKIWIEGPEDRGQQRDVPAEVIYTPTPLVPVGDIFADAPEKPNGGLFSYEELPVRYQRAVIIGDPGGGKSTLARMLCRNALAKCLGGAGSIAVTLTVRKYESAYQQNPQLTIFSFLVNEIALYTSIEEMDLAQSIRYFLGVGMITVIVDGIDEILSLNCRRDFVSYIRGFCSAFPLIPLYVTSRNVGYDRAPLPVADFPVLQLGQFSRTDSELYFKKNAQVVFKKSAAEAIEGCDVFFRSISEGSELCRNPLMLGLLVWLFYERRGNLPHDRAHLYKECSLLMFERWDEIRGVKSGIPTEYDLMHFLEHLASRLYTETELAAGVSRRWLENEAYIFFRERFARNVDLRAAEAAREMVAFITGRAWVMTDIGEGVYDFTHRTFLEYFFGRYLHSEYETAHELMSALEERIGNGMWHVPAHLAILRNHRRAHQIV